MIDWLKIQKDQDYEVDPRTLDHPDELKQLLYSMSGDERVFAIPNSSNEEDGGTITMCEFIDKLEAQGQLKLLAGLVKKGLLTIQQAAKEMGMSVAKFKAATKELATN